MAMGLDAGKAAEKRELAPFPTSIGTELPKEFGDWFSDHFGLRTQLVTGDAWYKYKLGYSTGDKVVVGRGEWLYFAETMPDYYRQSPMTDRELSILCETLDLIHSHFARQGVDFYFMAAPNKNTVYPEFMPLFVRPGDGLSDLSRLTAALSGRAYYLAAAIPPHGEGQVPLYHKRDSHWNNLGARIIYNQLMDKLAAGEAYDTYLDVVPVAVQNFQGDLDDMLLPALDMRDADYDFGIETRYKSRRQITDRMAMQITTTSEVNGRRVVFFRDSFFNNLIPFFSNNLGGADYRRAIPYPMQDVTAENFDAAVIEIAERNLRNVMSKTPVFPADEVILPDGVMGMKFDLDVTERGGLICLSGRLVADPDSVHEVYVVHGGRAYRAFRFDEDGGEGFSLYLDSGGYNPGDPVSLWVK